jgi:DNA replication protein DnaC
MLERTPQSVLNEAISVGPNTGEVARRLIEEARHPLTYLKGEEKMVKQTEQLIEHLKIKGVMTTLAQRLREAEDQELNCEEFLNLIFEDEKLHRENDRITRLLKRASFQQKASLESFEAKPSRGWIEKCLTTYL